MAISETIDAVARNAWAIARGSEIRPDSPTPSTVLWDEPHRRLVRFGAEGADRGTPVLLVPPLAAPASCFDLRTDQSLAQFLLDTGRTPYLIDYGDIAFADRRLGFEEWIDSILPEAVRQVSEDNDGEAVDIVAWCLGGTLSLLTAAAHTELPIRSIATVATPIDYSKLPTFSVVRSVARVTGGVANTTVSRILGGVPAPLVQMGYRATAFDREIKKPWFIVKNLHASETLARMQTVDRFMSQMPAYPGRLYGQMWGRLVRHNDLARGELRLGDRVIELADLDVPVLAIAGTDDAITSVDGARHVRDVLTGASSVQFETAPGSHLGVLAGPGAKDTTWPHIDRFLTEQQQPSQVRNS